MKRKLAVTGGIKRRRRFAGTEQMISTGSTLLDLAVSGGRVRGGGLPGGIFVEVFGSESTGKTVLLCEIAANVERAGGEILFRDPEARLNKQFAKLFGLDVKKIDYDCPSTVPEVFAPIRAWKLKDVKKINGAFIDSLAALTTDLEIDGGDKYGGRRGREFSEQLRLTCREILKKNILMVATNQLRQNIGVVFGEKKSPPGGEAIKFYSSLRLSIVGSRSIVKEAMVRNKKIRRVVGIRSMIKVHKSSVWEPGREAPVSIFFKYGIDDVRENLQFIKDMTGAGSYCFKNKRLSQSLDKATRRILDAGQERELREEVIRLWEEIEKHFDDNRKPKNDNR